MTHELPPVMKKILVRQIAVGTVVGCAFAAVYRYYDRGIFVPRVKDYYKQLSSGNVKN